jgi:hypothetical protein
VPRFARTRHAGRASVALALSSDLYRANERTNERGLLNTTFENRSTLSSLLEGRGWQQRETLLTVG